MDDDMILKEQAAGIVESWIEYYNDILELSNAESPSAQRIRSIIQTLKCVQEEIEEA